MGPKTFTRFCRATGVPCVSQATTEMYISMGKYMNLGVDCKMYMQVTTTFAFLVWHWYLKCCCRYTNGVIRGTWWLVELRRNRRWGREREENRLASCKYINMKQLKLELSGSEAGRLVRSFGVGDTCRWIQTEAENVLTTSSVTYEQWGLIAKRSATHSTLRAPVSQHSESGAVYLNGMMLLAPPGRMEVNLCCWLGGPSSHFSHSHARDPKYIKFITAAH